MEHLSAVYDQPRCAAPAESGAGGLSGASAFTLSRLEALTAESFFSGEVQRARAEVESLSRRLAGEDRGSASQQVLSVELATAHVHVLALESLLSVLLKKREERGARLVSALLIDATKRVVALANAHAGPRPRPVLVVGHADTVSVSAGESR